MAAATPMPVGKAHDPRRPGPEARPSRGWRVVPDTYFERLPFCLSPAAYIVVGQVLFWTRWGEAARHRDQQRDWFSIRQKAWAEKLKMTEGGLRKALREAEDSGCLVTRTSGGSKRELEYSCAVENFAKAPLRELSRCGNPDPRASRGQKPEPVAVPCPRELVSICPLPEMVGLERSVLKTQEKDKQHRNSSCGVSKPNKEGHRNSSHGIRPEIRELVESFTPRLGVGPSEEQLRRIEEKLKGASPEQFRLAVQVKCLKTPVTGYGIFELWAEDCARSRSAWERRTRGHARGASGAAPTVDRDHQRCVCGNAKTPEEDFCPGCRALLDGSAP